MKETPKSADEVAEMADKGEDVSEFFTGKGKMSYPTKRVNVDFTLEMLSELDRLAAKLNISRQSLIKTALRRELDNHYLATKANDAP